MTRAYAITLGSLAMALVVLRGAFRGELADSVATEAILALVVFAGIGAIAGWIAEYLVQTNVEALFRKRVDWYREGLIEQERQRDELKK